MDKKLLKRMVQIFGMLALSMLLFFASAGNLKQERAWLFFALYFVVLLMNSVLIITKHAASIARRRSEIKKGTKTWDVLITIVYSIASLGLFIAAGMDARAGIGMGGLFMIAAGTSMFFCGDGLVVWAMLANEYFYTTARIDPKQKPATNGPYAMIRHPGYAGSILYITAMPLILGSINALIVAIAIDLLIIVRTKLEDAMLVHELKSYGTYAKRVKYRLVPHVW